MKPFQFKIEDFTPKPYDYNTDTSKYFDTSSYNFDASKFNNFDSAADFGAFDFKK